jgi:CheY-like chemotaxis protein
MTTWMVVEDEPDLYDMVLAMYTTIGVDGISFVTGEEALEWIDEVDGGEFQGELPELALLDIRLPGDISGPMVGERIRNSPTIKDIVIVLMTAYHLSAQEEQSVIERATANLLLYKPLPRLQEFEQMLRDLLNGHSSDSSEPAHSIATDSSKPVDSPATDSSDATDVTTTDTTSTGATKSIEET